jgi:dinuclear metal center YbgI/SA1388 family protein
MTLTELETYFTTYLDIAKFPMDPSQNGVQVTNSDPNGKAIRRIAFAVDACMETISRAAKAGADILFVHHGLLWGKSEHVDGIYYSRLKALFAADMALYACHLPLDAHPVSGNNYGLASRVGLQNLVPFGEWRGAVIGVMGELPENRSLSPDELARALFPATAADCAFFPFGKTRIHKIAIVSGGAGDLTAQAAAMGVDAFVTGEVEHETYHVALDSGITIIAGGHYATETVGVSLVKEKVAAEFGLETVFIDVPTGL